MGEGHEDALMTLTEHNIKESEKKYLIECRCDLIADKWSTKILEKFAGDVIKVPFKR